MRLDDPPCYCVYYRTILQLGRRISMDHPLVARVSCSLGRLLMRSSGGIRGKMQAVELLSDSFSSFARIYGEAEANLLVRLQYGVYIL